VRRARARGVLRLAAGLLLLASPLGAASRKRAVDGASSVDAIERRYATLLLDHRPDLAARYGAHGGDPKQYRRFVALDETSIDAHVTSLHRLRAQAAALPATPRADTLLARLDREIAESSPGGGLRTDPALWLDIVEAAVRAQVADSTRGPCERSRRATLALVRVPEALRGATVLMRGAPPPDETVLEARLTRVEQFFRRDVPARTEACKEGHRRAELVEADSLAAASLAQFRRWVSWRG